MIWWLPPRWFQVLGGIQATLGNFKTAIQEGKILLYADSVSLHGDLGHEEPSQVLDSTFRTSRTGDQF